MMGLDKLQTVVLCRLWTVDEKASPARTASSLYPFANPGTSEKEWRRTFEETIEAARSNGLIDKRSLRLTKGGREQVKRALGGRPSATTWTEFKRKDLPRLVTNSASRTNLTAHLLSEALDCEGGEKATELVDQLIARSLGIRRAKVTLGSIRAALLAKELGVPVRPSLAEVTRLAAVKLSGARSGRPNDVLAAVLRNYLSAHMKDNGDGDSNGASSVNQVSETAESDFATKVLATARGHDVRRYGPTKVFIGSVWELLKTDAEMARLGETGFKDRLVEAHRRGVLSLSRADLVAAMDPADVRASETNHLGATYHFINTAGEQA